MSSPTATAPALLAARNAVFVVFFANGLVFASWASRLPTLRSDLDLSPAALGFTLLFISIGSVGSLPLSGPIVHRFGPRNAVAGAAVIVLVGIALVGFAPDVPVLAVSFLLCGMGIGTWDVAMNVEGADVEQQLGRPIMPRFHAGFSLGTVAGAGLGALLTHLDVGVAVHLPAVSLAAAVTLVFALRGFQPVEPEVDRAAGSGTAAAWRDRRTLILGLLVLGMAFAEGSANDWLAVGLVDGYDVSEAAGALGFAVFVTGMTAGRLVGPVLITRWGRVATVRGSGVLVLIGVGVLIAASEIVDTSRSLALGIAAVSSLAWGLGASLGFPVGMSAAGDEPAYAAARVSVVATIGYTAFLAGPPLLGLLGDRFGILQAQLVVAAAVLLSVLAAPAAAERLATSDEDPRPAD